MSQENIYDLIIIGGGPAGLSAAIYMARARYKTLLIEKDSFGGQISYTNDIVNYPGIMTSNGADLTHTMLKQAENFGALISQETVEELDLKNDLKIVRTNKNTYQALTVILAMGASPRSLGFAGEEKYKGRGIAYCATCDGEFFTDKDIFVVGGGVAAVEEAMFLTRYGKKVTMLVRKDRLSCPQPLIDQLNNFTPKIDVIYNHEVVALTGESLPHKLVYKNVKNNEETVYENKDDAFGVFIFSGYTPSTDLVKDQVELDDKGYIITNENLATNLNGVFAAGDLRNKSLRQVITACADGALAATEAEKIAFSLHEKLGLAKFEMPKAKVVGKHQSQSQEKKNEPVVTNEVRKNDKFTFIDPAMLPQLEAVFSRIEKEICLVAHNNQSNLGKEIQVFVEELKASYPTLSSRIENIAATEMAYISIEYRKKGEQEYQVLPYRFYGVPGGHEFTSFILALYHQLGPQKDIDLAAKELLQKISAPKHIDVVISLTCTKCPALLNAITQLMAHQPLLSLNVYDLNHAPDLKEKYRIMSVPCLISGEKVDFGALDQKSIAEWLL